MSDRVRVSLRYRVQRSILGTTWNFVRVASKNLSSLKRFTTVFFFCIVYSIKRAPATKPGSAQIERIDLLRLADICDHGRGSGRWRDGSCQTRMGTRAEFIPGGRVVRGFRVPSPERLAH